MGFLFFQIWVWLVVAFVAGWFAHWFFCCRGSAVEESVSDDSAVVPTDSDLTGNEVIEPEIGHTKVDNN